MVNKWNKEKIGKLMVVTSVKRVHESDWTKNGVPFYRAREIVGLFNKEKIEPLHISRELYNEFTKISGKIKENDLLVTGVGTIGIPYLIKKGDEFYFKDGNIIWFKNNNKINGKYFYYLFTSHYVQQQIFKNSGKGTVGTFTINSAKELEIILPEKKEQELIAESLSNIDNLIDSLQKTIEKKERIKFSVITDYLTGNKRLVNHDGKWIKTTMKDISNEVVKGNGLSKELLDKSGINKCILYGELFTTYNEVIESIKSCTNESVGTMSKKGDILIPGSTTTTGKDLAKACVIQENNVLLGGDINIIRVKENINPIYIAYLFSNILMKEVEKVAQGTTIIHLHGKNIEKVPIFIPKDKKEQDEIVNVLQNMDKEIEKLNIKLKKYKQIKAGMMEDLLTGKVRLCYE